MIQINTLPKSELKDVLSEKVEIIKERYPTIISSLENFVDRISQEVTQINELFPEYTPHDSKYHLTRLFGVADTLLGKKRYELMNSAELYVLAASLYAHDWGMAVSKSERYYIATGKTFGENKPEDFCLLTNERERFKEFLGKNKITTLITCDEDISIELWREYIRSTHALRSGERAYQYFTNINGGIADAVCNVCIGHWLNIEDICESKGFYMNAPALGQNINLKALTIYVRLIDLFDLSEERTPYVLWKYINPKDMYSAMEWKKHRALTSITCPPNENGRIICISGGTDDHQVYAAIQDLKNLCEQYFKESVSALARMNDSRHRLDIYYIDWQITARGFQPVSIQFEFNREKMFEILSSDIYNKNPYIFLRELLQNSIDAIRTRRAVLKKNNIGGENLGIIKVKAETQANGDVIILWEDDGIGMDEYIIKNYLAVAGKSYYSSRDFRIEELDINPISRFGVGILSCFMVCDRLEMTTYREPYIEQASVPLKIIISDIKRQFRVQELPRTVKVGTSIKLYVKREKLEQLNNTVATTRVDITEYLKYIAGFVEFPIVIDEDNRKTVIVHPDYDITKISSNHELSSYEIFKLKYNYPCENIFFIQDQETVKEFLEEKYYTIADEGIDVRVTYIDLKDSKMDIVNSGRCWPANDIELININDEKVAHIRWKEDWRRHRHTYVDYLNSNKFIATPIRTYNDGILIENARIDTLMYNQSDASHMFMQANLPVPFIVINICNKAKVDISISRTELRNELIDIKKIWNNHQTKLCEEVKMDLDDFSVLFQIASLQICKNVSAHIIWKYFKNKHLRFPFLNSDGTISFNELLENEIYITPKILNGKIFNLFDELYKDIKNIEGIGLWGGQTSLIIYEEDFDDGGNRKTIMGNMLQISRYFFKQQYFLEEILISNSIKDKSRCLVQEKWIKDEEEIIDDFIEIVDSILSKNYILRAKEIMYIFDQIRGSFYDIPKFVKFSASHKNLLVYGYEYINIESLFGRTLLKCFLILIKEKGKNNIDNLIVERLFDEYKKLPFFSSDFKYDKKTYNLKDINNTLIIIRNESIKIGMDEFEEEIFNIKIDDFVPGSLVYFEEKDEVTNIIELVV